MGLFDNVDLSNLGGGADYGTIGNAINNYVSGGSGDSYGTIGDTLSNYVGSDGGTSAGSSLGGLPWGKILNTVGRLGIGLGTGLSGYQAGQQANYIPYTRWLGNGLAMTGYINNSSNKQNQLDQAYGAGRALSSLLGNGYSLFGRENKLSGNLTQKDTSYLNTTDKDIYNDIYGGNYGAIGNAINNYMRY